MEKILNELKELSNVTRDDIVERELKIIKDEIKRCIDFNWTEFTHRMSGIGSGTIKRYGLFNMFKEYLPNKEVLKIVELLNECGYQSEVVEVGTLAGAWWFRISIKFKGL